MKKIIYFMISLTFLMSVVSCTSAPKTESKAIYNLAVLGMANELGIKEWEDNRVGFGLRIKLSELLYETKRFEMVEEKKEIKQKLEESAKLRWMSKKDLEFDYKDLVKEADVDYVAYGKVYYFGKPRRNASVGLVQFNKNITEIKVEITLENIKTGKKITEKGFGKAEVKANSILFSYNQDKVELNKTTVGMATEEALKDAVNNIMKKLN